MSHRKTRSQSKHNNLMMSSDEEDTQVIHPNGQNVAEPLRCVFCKKKKVPNFFKDYDSSQKCLCALMICEKCMEGSPPEEYCPRDFHENESELIENFSTKSIPEESVVDGINVNSPTIGRNLNKAADTLSAFNYVFKFDPMLNLNKPSLKGNFELIDLKQTENNFEFLKEGKIVWVPHIVLPIVIINHHTTINNFNMVDTYKTVNKNIYVQQDVQQSLAKLLCQILMKPKVWVLFLSFFYLLYSFGSSGSDILCSNIPSNVLPGFLCNQKTERKLSSDEILMSDLKRKIQSLENTYKKQSKDLWLTLKRGIRKLIREENESITILLIHAKNTTVDNCMLKDIRSVANEVIEYRNQNKWERGELADENHTLDSKSKGVIINMETSKEVFSNPGEFMEKYQSRLEKEKLMIILNFHKAPMIVMEAFHFISDNFDSYVKNAIIILTLEVKNTEFSGQIESIAEKELRQVLQALPIYKIDPLITRLTENVYVFKEERSFWFSDCPLV